MVIIDTTVWIDYLRGTTTKETLWFERERQVLGELSLFEIYDTGGEELAVAAARNFRLLRQRGRTVRKTIDGLIATFCLKQAYSLLHCDRDYNHFEAVLGLSVIHP